MTFRRPPRVRSRRNRPAVITAAVAAVAVGATLVGVQGYEALTPAPGATAGVVGTPSHDRTARGESGRVPDGVTVLDDGYAAVARLDPDLRAALREAAGDAEADGIAIVVNSGWRSPAYQQQLLDEAVSEYGSLEEAARWVATPETSPHVSGDAVDLGPSEAASWLEDHGASYGLCQVYANEPWHFELRPGAVDDGCPRPYADPTHDPRMRP